MSKWNRQCQNGVFKPQPQVQSPFDKMGTVYLHSTFQFFSWHPWGRGHIRSSQSPFGRHVMYLVPSGPIAQHICCPGFKYWSASSFIFNMQPLHWPLEEAGAFPSWSPSPRTMWTEMIKTKSDTRTEIIFLKNGFLRFCFQKIKIIPFFQLPVVKPAV